MTSATASSEPVSVSMKNGRFTGRRLRGQHRQAALEMAPLRLAADRRQRLPEFACGLVAASEPVEHLGARCVEEVMFGETCGVDRVERGEAGDEALCESDRD